ncbi:Transposable element Tcb2 transposase [Paramuricea clavata]|uniref:Transposable element Tcb2 transposase n=1 Tax=Paramuricea clavata TaxID=317549 RepID=A0A6S7JR49_PARCT|nr:Transposable element Tcb2 transposase [Paramuricea clavata]
MPQLSSCAKERINSLLQQKKYKIIQIVEILKKEDIVTTRQTVAKYIRRYDEPETANMQNKKPIGRRPKLDPEHLDFIDGEMEKNDELCAIDLRKLIIERFGLNVSISVLKRARKNLGWIKSGVRYCQLITEKNRVKRLAFARECLAHFTLCQFSLCYANYTLIAQPFRICLCRCSFVCSNLRMNCWTISV